MTIPGLIAFPLEEARDLLAAAGVERIEVVLTAPPRGGPSGPLRVIRQRSLPEGVALTVTPSMALEKKEPDHD